MWDLSDDNKLLMVLPTQNHWVRALAVSGKYLYSGSYRAVKVIKGEVALLVVSIIVVLFLCYY